MPNDNSEALTSYAVPKADMSFPEMPRSGVWREWPVRVPFWRGLGWLVELWSAKAAWYLFAGQMGVVAISTLMAWLWPDFVLHISSWEQTAGLFPVVSVMPYLVGITQGGLRNLTCTPKTGLGFFAVVLWNSLFLCLPTVVTLWGLEATAARLPHPDSTYGALFVALPVIVLCAGCFVLALWAVLVPVLTGKFWPDFPKALFRAGLAVWRNWPALVLGALALGCALTALVTVVRLASAGLPFASGGMKSRLVFLCLLLPQPFFLEETMLMPWLMARDMFFDADEAGSNGNLAKQPMG